MQQNPCFCLDVRALGILLPDLEVLKISNRFVPTFSRGAHLHEDELFLSDGNSYLQKAILQMKNLHTLELDLQYTGRGNERPAPKNPVLASLPKLATLKIPLAMLVMEHRRSNRDRISRLRNILPKSLRHLTVTIEVDCPDHWWFEGEPHSPTDPTWPPTSTMGILVFMETLSNLGCKAFPDICEIVCCYKMNCQDHRSQYGGEEMSKADFEEKDLFEFSEVDEDYDPQRFELLQTSLQKQKWQFTVAYEHTHCSCNVL